jgi:hypothetical protein
VRQLWLRIVTQRLHRQTDIDSVPYFFDPRGSFSRLTCRAIAPVLRRFKMENSAMPSDLLGLTAIQAVRLIHDGKLRPEALMEAYLDHIADRDSSVRAFVHFDPAQVRDATAWVQTGPLRGIPIGVKDVLDTADMPSQYGSPIWTGWRPKADSAPVAWAFKAGATVLGETVTTELRYNVLLVGVWAVR